MNREVFYDSFKAKRNKGIRKDTGRQNKFYFADLWGCLGKDTMLRTESGMKKISDITVGEKIFTEKGFVPLKNMVTGTEEKIVALGVSEDATLFITKKHPVATERGIIRTEVIKTFTILKLWIITIRYTVRSLKNPP